MAKQSFRISKPVKEKKEALTNSPVIDDLLEENLKYQNSLSDLLSYQKTPSINTVSTNKLLDDILLQAKSDELIEKTPENLFQQTSDIETDKKDLVIAFSEALMNNDIYSITELLADDGRFVIINHKFEPVIVNKTKYIEYLTINLDIQPVTSYKHDFCDGCFKGKLIMFYNEGSFPWNVLEQGFGRKAAFKFNIENNKMSTIRFCNNFMLKQNKMDYNKYKELYTKYRKKGYSIDDTVRLAKAEWNK